MAIAALTPQKLSVTAFLNNEKEIVYGVVDVTGTSTVQTGLQSIDIIIPKIAEDPALTAYWETAAVTDDTTDPGEVVLKVWKPTGTGDVTPLAGTTAALVAFIAIGDGSAS